MDKQRTVNRRIWRIYGNSASWETCNKIRDGILTVRSRNWNSEKTKHYSVCTFIVNHSTKQYFKFFFIFYLLGKGLNGKIILKLLSREWNDRAWIILSWIRKETIGGMFCKRWWTCGLGKMWVIRWLAGQRLTLQAGLGCMESINITHRINVIT